MSTENKPIFRDLNADDPDPEVTEIESMCMNCHQNGITRLLLTRIPHYKEIVLMSFACEECGFQNNEIQPGGVIAEKGVRYTVKIESPKDLNRQCVKSDYTSVKIEELDFEIPPQSQKGEVTTVEGIIDRSVSGLSQDQPVRRIEHPDAAEQLDAFIEKLTRLKDVQNNGGFTLTLEDVSGNTFVENPFAPQKDPNCHIVHFFRTKQQDHQIGIFTHEEVSENVSDGPAHDDNHLLSTADPGKHSLEGMLGEEVLIFKTNCPECNSPCDTNMKMTNIPHFKEVVIMATNCESCGNRTNEVKSGGGIEPQGIKMEVKVRGRDDFSRDILKSDTCSLSIPELDFEVGSMALGGRFTTTEGLLTATRDQLADGAATFGDTTTPSRISAMDRFLQRIDDVLCGKIEVTLVLDDPAGNSYVQSLNDDGTPDEGLRITHYDRSFEQNEELGLNDMKTENYEAC